MAEFREGRSRGPEASSLASSWHPVPFATGSLHTIGTCRVRSADVALKSFWYSSWHALSTKPHSPLSWESPPPLFTVCTYLLDMYLEGKLLGHMVVLFNFLRSYQAVFHSGCTALHTHQQCLRIPISPHHHRYLLLFFLKRCFYWFKERGREREGEKHQFAVFCIPPHWGSSPETPACALTSQCMGMALNKLSHTSQGDTCSFLCVGLCVGLFKKLKSFLL